MPLFLSDEISGPIAVIGDVHGSTELLNRLLKNLTNSIEDDCWIVFVGDFPDRGPDTRGVIDRILQLHADRSRVTACMGNHDKGLLGAAGLVPVTPQSNWGLRYLCDYSPLPTLTSYGVDLSSEEFLQLTDNLRKIRPFVNPHDKHYRGGSLPTELETVATSTLARVEQIFTEFQSKIPQTHQEFFRALPWLISHPDYYVVHAGLTKDPLESQLKSLKERNFLENRPPWLHESYLAFAAPPDECTKTVISGHSTVPEVTFIPQSRRILVDTFGGTGTRLSAVVLPEGRVVTSD